MSFYPTLTAAEDDLKAQGFTERTDIGDNLWSKPDKVDDWYGGYTTTALVEIVHNKVDKQWGKPDYYSLRFL